MTSKPDDQAERADEAGDHSSAAKDDAAVDPIVTEAAPNMLRASDSLASMGAALHDAAEQTKRLLSPPTMAPPRIPARSLGMADVAARLASTFPSMEERTRAARSIQMLAKEASRFHADVQQSYQRAADLIAPLSGASALMASQSAHEQLVRVMRVHEKQFEQMRYPTLPAFDADALASYRAAVAHIGAPLAGLKRLAAAEILRQREMLNWLRAQQLADLGRDSIDQIRKVIDSLSRMPRLSAYPSLSSGYIGTAYRASSDVSAFELPRPIRNASAGRGPDRREDSDQEQPKRNLLELDEDSLVLIGLLRLAEKRGIPKDKILHLILDLTTTRRGEPPLPACLGQPQHSGEAGITTAFADLSGAEMTVAQDGRRANSSTGQWVVARGGPAITRFARAYGHDRDGGSISKNEYGTLVAARDRYDFLIDGVSRRCLKRADGETTHQEARLTAAEYAVVQKLIVEGGIQGSRNLYSGASPSASTAIRQCEAARSRIDIKRGRYEFTLVRTHKSGPGGLRAYEFDPPEGIRWLLIDPHVQ